MARSSVKGQALPPSTVLRTQRIGCAQSHAIQCLVYVAPEHIGLTDKLFASLRLKMMRRGAQDYEMLRMLALKDGNVLFGIFGAKGSKAFIYPGPEADRVGRREKEFARNNEDALSREVAEIF